MGEEAPNPAGPLDSTLGDSRTRVLSRLSPSCLESSLGSMRAPELAESLSASVTSTLSSFSRFGRYWITVARYSVLSAQGLSLSHRILRHLIPAKNWMSARFFTSFFRR